MGEKVAGFEGYRSSRGEASLKRPVSVTGGECVGYGMVYLRLALASFATPTAPKHAAEYTKYNRLRVLP